MTFYLIRHGKTQGNLEHRYVGRTDEPLCEQGREALAEKHLPAVEKVYVSPMLRCRETAKLLYPDIPHEVVEDLRECDFGDFEYRTNEDLKDDPAFRTWIGTLGEAAPPNGESKADVAGRVLAAFHAIAARHEPEARIAIVSHGGTTMVLLEALEASHQYYTWQAPNGGGYRCQWDGKALIVEETIGV